MAKANPALGAPPSTGGQPPSVPGMNYGVVGPTSVPDFSNLLQYALKGVNPSVPSFQDTLQQGLGSSIFQDILTPALQNLIPGQDLARQSLMDEFRSAGSLGSGAMGVASSRLENSILGQQGDLISKVLAGFLPNLIAGYGQQSRNAFEPGQLLAQLLGENRPAIVTNQNIPGTAGGGGQISDPGGFLNTFNNPTGGPSVGGQGFGGPTRSGGGGGGSPAFGQVPYGPGSPFGTAPGVGGGALYGATNPGAMYDQWGQPLTGTAGGMTGLPIDSGGGGLGYGITYDPITGQYITDPWGGGGLDLSGQTWE